MLSYPKAFIFVVMVCLNPQNQTTLQDSEMDTTDFQFGEANQVPVNSINQVKHIKPCCIVKPRDITVSPAWSVTLTVAELTGDGDG